MRESSRDTGQHACTAVEQPLSKGIRTCAVSVSSGDDVSAHREGMHLEGVRKPNVPNGRWRLIYDLIDDEVRRARLGKFGRARVEHELAWPYQARAYLGVYDRMTGKAGG